MADPNNAEEMRLLSTQSAWAGLCLGMVSVHVRLPKGVTFHCYLMPWECMTRARAFLEIGAIGFSMHASGATHFAWEREREPVKRGRKPRIDFVNSRGE